MNQKPFVGPALSRPAGELRVLARSSRLDLEKGPQDCRKVTQRMEIEGGKTKEEMGIGTRFHAVTFFPVPVLVVCNGL